MNWRGSRAEENRRACYRQRMRRISQNVVTKLQLQITLSGWQDPSKWGYLKNDRT